MTRHKVVMVLCSFLLAGLTIINWWTFVGAVVGGLIALAFVALTDAVEDA